MHFAKEGKRDLYIYLHICFRVENEEGRQEVLYDYDDPQVSPVLFRNSFDDP